MRMMTTLHTSTLTPERTSYATTPEAAMSTTVPPKSPWHSPVPYLFGGLAAMLGLIAFALLILACSYWKLSRDDTQRRHHHNDDDEGISGDLESGDLKGDGLSKVNGVPIFEEKIVVIMAGNDKPTFLAKPAKMLNCKCNSNDDDDKDDHATVRNTTIAKDDGAKESSSVANDDDDGHHHDGHHHDGHDDDDDDDDDKSKEDEATTHHPHTSN